VGPTARSSASDNSASSASSNLLWPCATTIARSSRILRIWFISEVCRLTSLSATRSTICTSSCSSVFERNEAHRRAARGLGDRHWGALSSFLRLDIGTRIFGRYQLHLMPLRHQNATEVVRAATGLHCYDTIRQLGRQCVMVSRRNRRRITARPAASSPSALQLFLPKSTPRIRTSFMSPPGCRPVHDGGEGGPFHKVGDAAGNRYQPWRTQYRGSFLC
jgi:hypothetical protein